ncbi:putative solute carrier family 35 member SLC35F1/F2/F6 [Plasmopara halstedii]
MMLDAASGILSKYLILENASLPTLQSTCLYVVRGAVYFTVCYVRKATSRTYAVTFVALFCFLFLKTRFSACYYLGSTITFSGPIVISATEYTSSANGTSSRGIRGDMYALIAAAYYATSNVKI